MPNRRTFALGLAAGVLLGIALGLSLGGQDLSPPSGTDEPGAPRSAEPASLKEVPRMGRERPGRERAEPGDPGTVRSVVLQRELEETLAELARVQAELRAREALELAEQGRPLSPPASLPARFDSETLRRRVEEALRQAGFERAQVTSVDCTEYPCIVYGEGMGRREDFEKAKETPAFAPYRDDGRMAFGWSGSSADGPSTQHFGLAVFPDGERAARGDELGKRVDHRVRQMQQATRAR
jgi:hypothetical protein